MDTEKYRKKIQKEITCSVCLGYFTRPVELGCGHNFCERCILRCWEESGEETRCPDCRGAGEETRCPVCRRAVEKEFKQNRLLTNMVGIIHEWDRAAEREAQRRRWECQRHQKTLDPFCGDCDTSQGHTGHKVVPVAEAVQDYKDQPCRYMETLKEEKAENVACTRTTEKNSQGLLEKLMSDRQKMRSQFRQLHLFLEEQECRLLNQMEEVENEMNHRSALQRQEERLTFGIPNIIPYELMSNVRSFGDINTFLQGFVRQVKATLTSGLSLRKGFYLRK